MNSIAPLAPFIFRKVMRDGRGANLCDILLPSTSPMHQREASSALVASNPGAQKLTLVHIHNLKDTRRKGIFIPLTKHHFPNFNVNIYYV